MTPCRPDSVGVEWLCTVIKISSSSSTVRGANAERGLSVVARIACFLHHVSTCFVCLRLSRPDRKCDHQFWYISRNASHVSQWETYDRSRLIEVLVMLFEFRWLSSFDAGLSGTTSHR